MVCYIVPLIATLFGVGGRKALGKHGQKSLLLNVMLFGGALFGFVDHLWHGGLFVSANLAMDMMLGGTITLAIFASWGALAYRHHLMQPFRQLGRIIGFFE
ncbi:MAG: hypothetical protein JSV63_00015 [Candidatus Aenigmatarchaeota archaeon]|nr:MAG: hypothetical protein JSV63_00015 [Candidatus Aenigmarchaeota archaeon]